MAHSRAHHVLWFFRICKGLSTRWKILYSTQPLYQESSPFLWWSGSVADSQHLSCFWSYPLDWPVTSRCFTSLLAEIRGCAWPAAEHSQTRPPSATLELALMGSWQQGCGLETLCTQKRIQIQTEQVDPKVSGFSKGTSLQTAPGRT